jgi:hypothetical protein
LSAPTTGLTVDLIGVYVTGLGTLPNICDWLSGAGSPRAADCSESPPSAVRRGVT